jgi:hypothetical protein
MDSNHRYPAKFFGRPSIPAQFSFRNINRLPRDRDRWFESISLQRRVRCEPRPRRSRQHELADPFTRHRGVIGNEGEVALSLPHEFVDEPLRRADAHEPADHQSVQAVEADKQHVEIKAFCVRLWGRVPWSKCRPNLVLWIWFPLARFLPCLHGRNFGRPRSMKP